ncbi:MAG: ATP-binding cassette domain-containing protein [Clostridia bacterium]|nr:ATP-binding cassette domain-containing protein [Clostridia bacterium]
MQAVFSLTKISYRQILALPALEIPAGSIYGITGKSGSGKTTLLKLLNNLISCEQGGNVFYYGQNVLTIDPVSLRRRVVMIPQSPYIFPGTVRENIRLAFHFNRKEVPGQDVIDNLLDQLDLPDFMDKDTFNLSGGEKQRLVLARAMLIDPETLLLDEPTAALDDENATAVVSHLAQWVRKPGKSVVMITHAGALISEYADVILNLSRGRIRSLDERRGAND